MVRPTSAIVNHVLIQCKNFNMVGFRSISVDDCATEIYIGGIDMIKNQTRVLKVGKTKGAETNESEDEELSLGLAKSYERGLELFEMVERFAVVEYGYHAFCEVGGI